MPQVHLQEDYHNGLMCSSIPAGVPMGVGGEALQFVTFPTLPHTNIGTQPQRDVGWLHRLPYHTY